MASAKPTDEPEPELRTKLIRLAYAIPYVLITLLFFVCAIVLIFFAASELWRGVDPRGGASIRDRFQFVLEGIGMLTIAVASLELSQTVLEEEVHRQAAMSTPTRVRRFLSRFMIVVVVSLSIEFLILVFDLMHRDPGYLPHAAAIGAGAALLLLAWGAFIRLNTAAEALEPEASERTKREDKKLEA